MKIKIFLWIVLFLSIAGMVNAWLVYDKAQNGQPIPCFVVSGCDAVQESSYAYVFGIPLSLFGIVYYGLLAVLSVIFLTHHVKSNFISQMLRMSHPRFPLFLLGYVLAGFLFSLYLFALQLFVIRAWCSSCLLSLADIVLITACTGFLSRQK